MFPERAQEDFQLILGRDAGRKGCLGTCTGSEGCGSRRVAGLEARLVAQPGDRDTKGTVLPDYLQEGSQITCISERCIHERHISTRRISKRCISTRRISKRCVSKRRISKRHISKRHTSKRHISKCTSPPFPAESGQWVFLFLFGEGFVTKCLLQKPSWQHKWGAEVSIQMYRMDLSPSPIIRH